ncbi:murein biosynthesis protein MurJ [Demequina sp. TTPB684]|uniref:murein biosynthesis integral membrane protein MurJ n=1 Tax=unclassified Demequina TaxID=2620311 RepID=UPI001CF4EBB9|nr:MULTISPECIES: lipid II flippase MurJ [unclassified Demequina]MCB2413398.1 murein biosynthesis protein MurJ [Demequina sp. TTPB684]UPU87962.1 murein biosynthesis protein MurJ [Demequina sp. TMPB413]
MTTEGSDATPPIDPAGPGAAGGGATASSGQVGRHALVMASGTLVSRALGMVRSTLLVIAIGLTGSVAADAYAVANKLPNVMFAVLAAGVLNSALVPQIVKSFQADRVRTVHRILTLGGVGILAVTTLLTVTAGLWVRLYSNWDADQTALATAFAFWCIPQLLFYGLYTLFGQVLNAREQFGWFMWAPVANNVVAIAGLVAYLALFGRYMLDENASVSAIVGQWTTTKIVLVAGVATLGIAAQALILIPPMIRGGYRWRWVWRGPKGELRTVTRVASWALAAVVVEQVGVAAITNIASAASDAAPKDPTVAGVFGYDFALGIFLMPHSLISVSLMTVLFTQMARHASNANMARLRDVISEGVRNIGVLTMIAGAIMVVASPHLVRVLALSASVESVAAVAWVLAIMSLALVPLGASVIVKQAYFALEDGRTVFLIHIPMTLAWLAVAYSVKGLMDPVWWVRGAALGLVATNVVAVVLRTWGLYRRLGGVDLRRILVTYAKAATAASLAIVVGVGILAVGPHSWNDQGVTAVMTSVGMSAAIGIAMFAVYAGASKVLKVSEVSAAVSAVTRRLRRVR